MATIPQIQTKFLEKLESKMPGGKALSPALLKKTLNHFDSDSDGWLSLNEFVQCADGKIDVEEAEFLFMSWDTLGGQQDPCGMASIEYAVADLLGSLPQYSTLLKGHDAAVIAGRGQGNRSSQEGGIFGGGHYAADSEREVLSARNRPAASENRSEPLRAEFRKPVNNESSIQGGIFGGGADSGDPPPSSRSNKSNQSSVQGGIFNQEPAQPQRSGRNANASSIPGGIFG